MRKLAFVFPGQGSQHVGMGGELAKGFKIGEALFKRAGKALGFDIEKLCLEGPEDELKKTAITQPAIFTVSAICFEVLREKGIMPEVVAGHSLGEYSALYAAGSISFEDCVKVLHLRGRFMQEAAPLGSGSMAAILGLDLEGVIEVCKRSGAEAANINSPAQVVISGKKEAVAAAMQMAKEAGAKRTIELAVSAPFHSSLMRPAEIKLAEELRKIKIKDAAYPLFANVTARPAKGGEEIMALLTKQVTSPVLWSDSVKNMIEGGIDTFVEVGPKKVLSGLIKNIDDKVTILNVEDLASLEATLKGVAQ